MTDEDWSRAASAVQARMGELRLDRSAVARAAGVDRKTIDNFLDRGMKPRTDKRGGYEEALQWQYGSLLAVARGGQPTVTEQNPRPEGEIDQSSVGRGSEDAEYVADRGPNDPPARITDEELLAVIRRQRQELDELERRLTGGPVDGAS